MSDNITQVKVVFEKVRPGDALTFEQKVNQALDTISDMGGQVINVSVRPVPNMSVDQALQTNMQSSNHQDILIGQITYELSKMQYARWSHKLSEAIY